MVEAGGVTEGTVGEYSRNLEVIRREIAKIIVGQQEVVNGLLLGLLCNGHVLVEGVPGIAKTLLIRALAKVTGCEFKRIQFTVDLLPTDITGITAYHKDKGFYVVKGPVFTNFILADEINRAPPKVQSALLEAMGERQVTIGKETFRLDDPFFVMATQNPIETAGTYPLPEAQVDRFLLKLYMEYPNIGEEQRILKQNINLYKFENFGLKPVISPKDILQMQQDVKNIYMSKKIEQYCVSLTDATRNPKKYKIKLGRYIQWGGSPRTSIGLFIVSKANALIHGKNFVIPDFVKEVAHPIMRHRLLLNYEGLAEGVKTDDIIKEVLEKVPVP
ncbi:MAG: AAA domain-containing protein [Candidatus Aenigmarchaeota archaeon]|nr:AAA domain-containing protein [Candidatus Aenigmarchaeota archaeon]NIP41068.1 AAA domain-containing protein [Candidatus Aenigmarchaeota archaeon]NIQ17470.1 AAA domain-containing protein [Candidatus Aenigmarchaeota archaeon]NIS73664.1 AAA domain-containing protein [Candidatus Aenigmarchaeota archaeon]